MGSEDTRWRCAGAISIALHVLLLMWTWTSERRTGTGSTASHEGRARAAAGPHFEPGAVLPIELTAVEPVEPAPGPAATASAAIPHDDRDGSTLDARGSTRERADGAQPRPLGSLPTELPTEPEAPDERFASGAQPSAGLLGSGRELTGLDPGVLRGSRAIYEGSSAGVAEGPRRRPADRGGRSPGADHAFEREGNEWVYRHPNGLFTATIEPDGRVKFKDKLVKVRVEATPSIARDNETFITLVVDHDAVGVAEAARGADPSPRAKALLLAETFEMRLEIAIDYHKHRLIDQLGQLDDELRAIWNARGRSLAERRRLLFELWDGCIEPEGSELEGFPDADISELDETRRKLSGVARRKVVRFIGEVAPAGSDEAYTDAELAALNEHRVSAQRFSPYSRPYSKSDHPG